MRAYDTGELHQEVVDWANRQEVGPGKRAAFLEELAGKVEDDGHAAGAEWLRFFAEVVSRREGTGFSVIWPWTVVTHYKGHRYGRRFPTTIQAQVWVDHIQGLQPGVKQWLVNTHQPTKKPEDLQMEPSKLWCPWCAAAYRFYHDPSNGYQVCYVCGISTTEYFTRFYNFGEQTLAQSDARVERKREKRERRHRRKGEPPEDED